MMRSQRSAMAAYYCDMAVYVWQEYNDPAIMAVFVLAAMQEWAKDGREW